MMYEVNMWVVQSDGRHKRVFPCYVGQQPLASICYAGCDDKIYAEDSNRTATGTNRQQ